MEEPGRGTEEYGAQEILPEEATLLEEVLEKRGRAEKRQPYHDIVITQAILCLLLCLAMAVLNLMRAELAQTLVERYRSLTAPEAQALAVMLRGILGVG